MKQEDKELLLKDLCSRLPYRVKIKFAFNKDIEKNNNLIYVSGDEQSYIHNSCMVLTEDNIKYVFNDWVDECKPYLRPISSMTEEESAKLSNIINEWFDKELFYLTEEPFLEYALSRINYSISPLLFDWLNAHYFDYRGLIEKGLALEAPEGMYTLKVR